MIDAILPDPANTLLLMPCGAAKIATDVPVPLYELYDGPLWRDLRVHAGALPMGNVFVLSGKHGFASSWCHTRPYEQKISAERVDRLLANGIHDSWGWLLPKERRGAHSGSIHANVHRHDGRPYSQVISVGSGEYARGFRGIVEQLVAESEVLSADTVVVTIDGSILQQRKAFNSALRVINGGTP